MSTPVFFFADEIKSLGMKVIRAGEESRSEVAVLGVRQVEPSDTAFLVRKYDECLSFHPDKESLAEARQRFIKTFGLEAVNGTR